MMIDLAAEYFAALCDTSERMLRPLREAGATERGMALAAPAIARLQLNGGNRFEPDPQSPAQAFIVPVRVEHPGTPESSNPTAALCDGDIVDLVAFTPALRARWALRVGTAEWLGACPPQYLEPPPVKLFRTPVDWMRGDCEGLVCLAAAPLEVYRFLTRLYAISVEDDEHAAELRAVLDRPVFHPEIFVMGRGSNGR